MHKSKLDCRIPVEGDLLSQPSAKPSTQRTVKDIALSVLPGVGAYHLGQKKKAAVMAVTAPVSIFFAWYDTRVLNRRLEERGSVGEWECYWSKSKWKLVGTENLQTFELLVGQECRTIDNSSSDASVERQLRVSREWGTSCTIEKESIETTSETKENFSFDGLKIRVSGSRKSKTVETTLRERFARTEEEKHLYEETVTIVVAPRKCTQIHFRWKHHIQSGVLVLEDQFGNRVTAPFQVVTNMTFDQAHIDRIDPPLEDPSVIELTPKQNRKSTDSRGEP